MPRSASQPLTTALNAAGRSCRVGDATALAALVRSKPGTLRLRDYGSCSSRPADGGGLFVRSIRADVNRGRDGWVYKVGRRAATAGAADPTGPFGRGRLKRGQRVTWFYCRLRDGGCQRTLELTWRAEPGRGVAVAGATVSAGGTSAATGGDGVARLDLPAGTYRAVATKPGLVRSFTERVEVP